MKLICVKLNSGEEIVAKVCEEQGLNEKVLRIDQPRVLLIQDMGNGQVGASFVPALIMGGDLGVKIVLDNSSMYTYSISAENEKRYLQAVSGIKLATSLQG